MQSSDDAPRGPVDLVDRSVQLQGSAWARGVLRLLGWQLVFDGLPSRQGVLLVYPHTSNWDFPIGILAKWAIGIPVTFWGKESLFSWPLFGRWLRWVGGVPVVRNAPQGAVSSMVECLRNARLRDEFMWLALAPEGTRRLRAAWRSGFYRVAVGAGVPLGLAVLDFGSRRVGLLHFIQPCGSPDDDMAGLAHRYLGVKGFRDECVTPVRLG